MWLERNGYHFADDIPNAFLIAPLSCNSLYTDVRFQWSDGSPITDGPANGWLLSWWQTNTWTDDGLARDGYARHEASMI